MHLEKRGLCADSSPVGASRMGSGPGQEVLIPHFFPFIEENITKAELI